jgi:competence protein ComEA
MKSIWILMAAASLCLALADDDDAKSLPDGPGKEIVAKVCIDCHGAANFRKKRLPESEWWDQVARMVHRGAKASEQEQAAVVAYLTRNFGEDSKVNMNSAPLSEMVAILGLTPSESEAIVAYRKDYGNFKEWRNLVKVPGVDARKVEDKKERMAF